MIPGSSRDQTDLASLLAPFQVAVGSPIDTRNWWMNWIIRLDEDPQALTNDDLEDLILHANLLGVVIDNIQMTQQLVAANEQIEREMQRIGENSMHRYYPTVRQKILVCDIVHCSYETATQAGGDFVLIYKCRLTRTAGR